MSLGSTQPVPNHHKVPSKCIELPLVQTTGYGYGNRTLDLPLGLGRQEHVKQHSTLKSRCVLSLSNVSRRSLTSLNCFQCMISGLFPRCLESNTGSINKETFSRDGKMLGKSFPPFPLLILRLEAPLSRDLSSVIFL